MDGSPPRGADGAFDPAAYVYARRRMEGSLGSTVRSSSSEHLPPSIRAAEVCAARRRFDGALGREGTGGAESFQPKFTRRALVAEAGIEVKRTPAPVIDLVEAGGLQAPGPGSGGPDHERDFRDVSSDEDRRIRSAQLADRAAAVLARIDRERGGQVRPRVVPERQRVVGRPTPLPPIDLTGRTPLPAFSPVLLHEAPITGAALSGSAPEVAVSAAPTSVPPSTSPSPAPSMPPIFSGRVVAHNAGRAIATPVIVGPGTMPGRAADQEHVGFEAVVAKIRTIGALRNEGLITDAEYERTKSRLLDRI